MYKAKRIIEKGTRYFYDEDGFCYKKESFSRVYKVKPGFPEITLPEGSSEFVDKAIQEAERKLSDNKGDKDNG